MKIMAEVKPSADVEYLAAALIRDAVRQKFMDLFGRTPVERTADSPMVVKDSRVPDMIGTTVDPVIAKMLKSSAIEVSEHAAGEVPPINNCTLLYAFVDKEPSQVSLESVKEYQELDKAAVDATLAKINEMQDINIQEGIAFVSADHSAIEVAVYIDNGLLAEEFQYRTAAAGGNQITSEDKVEIFNDLYQELPGGERAESGTVKSNLMRVVGLGEEAPSQAAIPDAAKAPGPEPITGQEQEQETAPELQQKTESITFDSFIHKAMETHSGWTALATFLQVECQFDSTEMQQAQQSYIVQASNRAVPAWGHIVVGSIVCPIMAPTQTCVVQAILAQGKTAEVLLQDSMSTDQFIVPASEITLY